MDTTGLKKPKNALIIAVIAAVIVILVVVVVVAAMLRSGDQDSSARSSANGTQVTAKDEELQNNLAILDDAIKQATADQTAVKAVLDASKKNVVVADAKAPLTQLRDRATKELDRRTGVLQDAQKKLGVSAQQTKAAASSKAVISGVEGLTTVKGKIAYAIDDAVSKLAALKKSVTSASKLSEVQATVATIDSRYTTDQVLYAQATVAQAVTSIVAVTNALSTVKGNLQTVASEQSCEDCADDESQQNAAQAQVDNAAALLSTVKSNSSSMVVLLSAVTTTLSTLPAGSNASALLTTLTAIESQLGITNTLAEAMRQEFKAIADVKS